MSDFPFGKEFQVGTHTYLAQKMNAKQQFHVARRVLPLLASAGNGESVMDKLRGAAEALSEISDKDADYVIDHCLAVVKRKMAEGRGWAPIWSTGADKLMFEDISMMEMLQITGEVLAFNLGNFSDALPEGVKSMVEAQEMSPGMNIFTSKAEKTGS